MSNRIPVLAAEIKRAAVVMKGAERTAADAAIVAGRLLIEAKTLVDHGQWLPFLKETGLHERAAQRFMSLAASNLKSDMVSFLGGINPALRFLALRKQALLAMGEAEAEAIAGSDEILEPMARVLELIDDMVAMFPTEFVEAHRAEWEGA
ncbi:DUF3102 domain-containing protein [Mesorhizobium sp. WSM4313]|uniref:DUF3102 domain-containing protein n=1 Tax=Mesorhizobium sp. WSM4313 TaxID=2029412 RepID=UPI000BAEE4EC|nr:DUF3102 domain-containing protein [Mesorhizobium sp. WSM4313]PBB20563.1 hypothetical protein CK219_05345 [Mesorhizobium sp. WSM4313]